MKSRVSVVVLLVLALSLVVVVPAYAAPVLTDGLDFTHKTGSKTLRWRLATLGAVLHGEGGGYARLSNLLVEPRPQLGLSQRVRRGRAWAITASTGPPASRLVCPSPRPHPSKAARCPMATASRDR